MSASTLAALMRAAAGRHVGAVPSRERAVAMLRDVPARQRHVLLGLGVWSGAMLLLALALPASAPDLEEASAARDMSPSDAQTRRQIAEAIAARPVFNAGRRAAIVNVPSAPQPIPLRDRSLRLGGIFIDGSATKALVVSSEQPQGAWLTVGETTGGWTIAAIKATSLDLRADGETFTISLPDAGGAVP